MDKRVLNSLLKVIGSSSSYFLDLHFYFATAHFQVQRKSDKKTIFTFCWTIH